jgi:helix-turn-helix protein
MGWIAPLVSELIPLLDVLTQSRGRRTAPRGSRSAIRQGCCAGLDGEGRIRMNDQDTVRAFAGCFVGGGCHAACVLLRYSYRLYPTSAQRVALARAFGCARVVFNDALAARQAAHAARQPYITDAALSARLTQAKATPERAWLREVSSVVLQQALADLNHAYRNFFDSLSGNRKGPKMEPPGFRSRKDPRQSVRFTANACFKVLGNGRLRLPKIGDVTCRAHPLRSP